MLKHRKGILFTLETFIAALIVLTTLMILYSEPVDIPGFREDMIRKNTYECIRNLDLSGELRAPVKNHDRQKVFSRMESCVSPQIGYNLAFCDRGGCEDVSLPGNRTVVSSSYYVSGQGDGFFPTEIKVYGWAK